jgi:hypothetical protein
MHDEIETVIEEAAAPAAEPATQEGGEGDKDPIAETTTTDGE